MTVDRMRFRAAEALYSDQRETEFESTVTFEDGREAQFQSRIAIEDIGLDIGPGAASGAPPGDAADLGAKGSAHV